MTVQEYLDFLVNEIHSTVFATVDSEGRPVTCAIDIMDYDESGLYFLTARGKNFYDRLKANENVAFTAMKGETPSPVWRCQCKEKPKRSVRTSCLSCFAKIPIWRKFILICAPAALSRCSKSMKEPANRLTSRNFPSNGSAFPSEALWQKKMATL